MLEIRKVTRRFGGNVAVKNVELDIPNGQMVGVIGRSGAGKSTLLRMINRLIDPSEGVIKFSGVEVSALRGAKLRAWQRDCAMIFQQFNLVPRLDVLTNVLLGRLNHRSAQAALQRAGTLSGGQQQRVAIARALMQQPKVILADEPIASLDPMNAKIVMDSLADINRREGITVVTNLHTLDTARNYCERVVGMAAGEVVFDGPAEDLTTEAVRMIYGADSDGSDISEEITSTSIDTRRPKVKASTASLEPALAGF